MKPNYIHGSRRNVGRCGTPVGQRTGAFNAAGWIVVPAPRSGSALPFPRCCITCARFLPTGSQSWPSDGRPGVAQATATPTMKPAPPRGA